jgi:DNA-binding MarR family transcriptional regulator
MNTGLGSEIKQARPFRSPTQEAFLNLVRTAAVLEHAFEDALKPFGVTATQYNVLRILRGAGEAGLCRNDVTSRMITPVPDATRLLDRLEARGYVERRRDADDRRFVTTRISAAGLELLREMERPVAERHDAQLGHMAASELEQLIALLERARAETV